jgi:GNAT superfamily N-acetyltransferase
MKVLSIQDAHKALGDSVFGKDLEYMCFETYNLWYENYYSRNLDTFPNWQSLYDTFMDISIYKKRNSYFNCYVAIEDNHMVGFISLNFNDFSIYESDNVNESSLWLTDLFVWPQYRNKGIGKLLVKYVSSLAKRMDISLHLACSPDMINYYRKLGWSILTTIELSNHIHWTYMINKFTE